MDYQKIYDQIIEKAKRESRSKGGETYYEAHHILPKCLGGEGHESQWKYHSNIILLTAREHFICHWLLVRVYPENAKLIYALWMMSNRVGGRRENRYIPSSRAYEEARGLHSKELKKKPAWNTGKLPVRRGISQTKEHVEKRVKAHKGSVRTEESRQRMSEARKGKVPWNRGKVRSEELNKKYKKPILHIESGVIYSSINEAALAFKCSGQAISNRVKKGIFKTIQ
jgi:hypothetical protein